MLVQGRTEDAIATARKALTEMDIEVLSYVDRAFGVLSEVEGGDCWLSDTSLVIPQQFHAVRSLARQNSLTLWPLCLYSSSHSAHSAAVHLTRPRGLGVDGAAVGILDFVIVQVLVVENLRRHLSPSR